MNIEIELIGKEKFLYDADEHQLEETPFFLLVRKYPTGILVAQFPLKFIYKVLVLDKEKSTQSFDVEGDAAELVTLISHASDDVEAFKHAQEYLYAVLGAERPDREQVRGEND